MEFQYNLLNLPSKITYQDGRMINYIYSATGTKLSVTYTNGGTIKNNQYCGNMLYENGMLKQILIDGGYITFNGSTPQYHFYLKDHLGNNRVVVNASGTVEQVNHYYPYGGLMGESTNGDIQRYKYNGKELDRMNGLDWYDYGARHMDGIRFTTIDPMAEKYYGVSPYVYCHNNPFNTVDPDGRDDYYSSDGQFLFRDQKETDNIIIRNQFLYDIKSMTGAEWINPDTQLANADISAAAYSAIFTDILKRNGFDTSFLKNGQISIVKLKDNTNGDGSQYEADGFYNHDAIIPYSDADIARSKKVNEHYEITAYCHPIGDENREYLSTISNVISILGVHEFNGHGHLNIKGNQHWRILQLQRRHSSWKSVSPQLKALYKYLETNKIDNYNKR